MNFLENFAIPQSAHHMELLYGMLIVTFILFIPYLSLITGSLFLSLCFNGKGRRTGDVVYFRVAKRIIDLITFNKSVSFALGVIPLLSIIFAYAQLLQGTSSGVPEYLLFALAVLLAGIISLYTYKYSFHVKDLLSAAENQSGEALKYKNAAQKLFSKTGKYSVSFILLTAWIFFGAVSIARENSMWNNNVYDLLFSLDAIVNFLGFIVLSIFITSILLFYIYFRPNTEFTLEEREKEILKNSSLRSALVSLIFLPAFILLDILFTSNESLNGSIFIYALFTVVTLLFIGNFIYLMIRKNHTDYVTSVLFLSLIAVFFLVLKDQSAFETTTKQQFVQLSSDYSAYKEEMQKKFGSFVEKISGADIYNGRCIACHSFDKRVVGPPYNSVLGNYVGKTDELVNFVMNPVKKNPEYPSMPNQGLKPNEAKAVAEYILQEYSKNNPK